MSAWARWWSVTRGELRSGLRRPAYWLLFAILALMAWGFSEGAVTISSGDSTVGGERSYVTSVFAQSMIQSILIMAIGAWFLAIAAGLVVIRDLELQVTEVFHSTRLTPGEYVWGKFAGALGVFFVIWLLYVLMGAGFNHIVAAGRMRSTSARSPSATTCIPRFSSDSPRSFSSRGCPSCWGPRHDRRSSCSPSPWSFCSSPWGF